VSFSKSHERNFVEEYVEFLMSLSDDLQEIWVDGGGVNMFIDLCTKQNV
jgi:hypothetical protein